MLYFDYGKKIDVLRMVLLYLQVIKLRCDLRV